MNKNKLPKTFKKKWIAALRSGQYKQGECSLHRDNAFCCLGVAAVICGASIKSIDGKVDLKDLNFDLDIKIPHLLNHDIGESELVDKLINFNDTGKSFNWIASYIERYL